MNKMLSPRKYWSDLKSKLIKEGVSQLFDKIERLKMTSTDGRERATDAVIKAIKKGLITIGS